MSKALMALLETRDGGRDERGDFDPDGGNNASYVASTGYSGNLSGLSELCRRAPATGSVGPEECFRSLRRARVAASLDLHLDARQPHRPRRGPRRHDPNDADRQTRDLATAVAKKVWVLRAPFATVTPHELEAPQASQVGAGDQTHTNEIHEVPV